MQEEKAEAKAHVADIARIFSLPASAISVY